MQIMVQLRGWHASELSENQRMNQFSSKNFANIFSHEVDMKLSSATHTCVPLNNLTN